MGRENFPDIILQTIMSVKDDVCKIVLSSGQSEITQTFEFFRCPQKQVTEKIVCKITSQTFKKWTFTNVLNRSLWIVKSTGCKNAQRIVNIEFYEHLNPHVMVREKYGPENCISRDK